MYVCVCQALTETEVHGHVAGGARTVRDVRSVCGMRPGCGSCVRKICALIQQADGPIDTPLLGRLASSHDVRAGVRGGETAA